MKHDNYINQFIESEKQIKFNSFLKTQIIAEIEQINSRKQKAIKWLLIFQYSAFAASIVVAGLLGVNFGNSYIKNKETYISMNINDDNIENLNLLNTINND